MKAHKFLRDSLQSGHQGTQYICYAWEDSVTNPLKCGLCRLWIMWIIWVMWVLWIAWVMGYESSKYSAAQGMLCPSLWPLKRTPKNMIWTLCFSNFLLQTLEGWAQLPLDTCWVAITLINCNSESSAPHVEYGMNFITCVPVLIISGCCCCLDSHFDLSVITASMTCGNLDSLVHLVCYTGCKVFKSSCRVLVV